MGICMVAWLVKIYNVGITVHWLPSHDNSLTLLVMQATQSHQCV